LDQEDADKKIENLAEEELEAEYLTQLETDELLRKLQTAKDVADQISDEERAEALERAKYE